MAKRLLTTFPLFVIGFVALLYIGACAFLYAVQDSFIFYPVKNDKRLLNEWSQRRVEISGPEGIIEGWWAENLSSRTAAVVLYFGGNAEDALYSASAAGKFAARRVLVTNYRGYGALPGKPSERALFADALAVYDYAVKQPNVSASNIVVMGRSLGSGVATYIAAKRPVRGVILITPYDSIVSVAKNMFSFFPVRWLLRNKFPSDKLAHKVSTPALILAAENDHVIPPVHAVRLHAAWAGPKDFYVLDQVGHNNIEQHFDYYPTINAFLAR